MTVAAFGPEGSTPKAMGPSLWAATPSTSIGWRMPSSTVVFLRENLSVIHVINADALQLLTWSRGRLRITTTICGPRGMRLRSAEAYFPVSSSFWSRRDDELAI